MTLRLHRATLRHYMALPEQSWHAQLLEFLDVLDDPVLGYLPPTVITVLHTHLFSCAVDYRYPGRVGRRGAGRKGPAHGGGEPAPARV